MKTPRPRARGETQAALLTQIQVAIAGGNPRDIEKILDPLHPGEIASLLAAFPIPQREIVWRAMPRKHIGATLHKTTEAIRTKLLADTSPGILHEAMDELDVDDIADLIPGLPEELAEEFLSESDPAVLARLQADPDTAARLMHTDTLTVRPDASIADIARRLPRRPQLPPCTDQIFVTAPDNNLTGSLPIAALLRAATSQPQLLAAQVMDPAPLTFNAGASKEDIVTAFRQREPLSAAVIDDTGKLVGRITVYNVIHTIEHDADHALMAHAGLDEDEDIFAPPLQTFQNRALWLGVNLATAILASWVIGLFEETIQKLVALAVLMPIIASMGGNTGTQTMTVTVRGLGTGSVNRHNALRLLRKELAVGGFNSLLWAVTAACTALVWYGDLTLGLIMAAAMCINMISSAVAGVLIPLLFDRIGVDPALASGVALTTVTDVVGFFAVLGFAAMLI